MTEDDPAIEAIKRFLRTAGFDPAQEKPGVEDGNWLLARIDFLCRACCEATYEAGLRTALQMLESDTYLGDTPQSATASRWTPQDTQKVLEQAKLTLNKGRP